MTRKGTLVVSTILVLSAAYFVWWLFHGRISIDFLVLTIACQLTLSSPRVGWPLTTAMLALYWVQQARLSVAEIHSLLQANGPGGLLSAVTHSVAAMLLLGAIVLLLLENPWKRPRNTSI